MSLSELWKSKNWKEASANFIEGKPCAWCGAKPGDTYTDSKGKERKLGFAPHHIEKHKWGLPLYNEIKTKLFNKRDKTEDAYYEVPYYLNKRQANKYFKDSWHLRHKDEVKNLFEKAKQEIFDAYVNLSQDKIIVLCTRCHFAREKNLHPCPICGGRKGYSVRHDEPCKSCKEELIQKEGETEDGN